MHQQEDDYACVDAWTTGITLKLLKEFYDKTLAILKEQNIFLTFDNKPTSKPNIILCLKELFKQNKSSYVQFQKIFADQLNNKKESDTPLGKIIKKNKKLDLKNHPVFSMYCFIIYYVFSNYLYNILILFIDMNSLDFLNTSTPVKTEANIEFKATKELVCNNILF